MRYAIYERSRCCSYYNSIRRRSWHPVFETGDIMEAVRDRLRSMRTDLPESILDKERAVVIDLEYGKAFPITSCLPCMGQTKALGKGPISIDAL